MAVDSQTLKELLVDSGRITFDQFTSSAKTAKHLNVSIIEVLIGRRLIAEKDLGEILAKSAGVPFVDLKHIDIAQNVIDLIPQEMAISMRVVPFEHKENKLSLAMEDATNLETIEFVRKKTDLDVVPYLATPNGIKYALRFYRKGIKEFIRLSQEWTKSTLTADVGAERLAQDVSIVRLVDTMVEYAASEEASDIHIEGLSDGVLIRYRVDGILHDIVTLPKKLHQALIARIKILSDLKLDETRRPQDGRFRFKTKEGELISLRVSIMPSVEGEKVVLRLLESVLQRFGLEELGLGSYDSKIVKTAISKPHGLILVTGPTGSGKTTTLYTILGLLNTPEVNISTIEDPVENRIPRVTQTQVNPQIGLSFADGLRSLLRQDPDIIMVGEIRDRETGSIAVNAALTGHIVLSTLHTNDAASAIPRLIDLGVEPFLIASTLNLIIAQRLVRLTCSECQVENKLHQETVDELKNILAKEGYNLQEIENIVVQTYHRGEGCSHCNWVGYKGRTGIYELLPVDDSIHSLVVKKTSAEEIKKVALSKGMKTMLYDGMMKVKDKKTTVEEVLRVTAE